MNELITIYFLAGLFLLNFLFVYSTDFRTAILQSPVASFLFYPGLIAVVFFTKDEEDGESSADS